jgi:hypothetical protein
MKQPQPFDEVTVVDVGGVSHSNSSSNNNTTSSGITTPAKKPQQEPIKSGAGGDDYSNDSRLRSPTGVQEFPKVEAEGTSSYSDSEKPTPSSPPTTSGSTSSSNNAAAIKYESFRHEKMPEDERGHGGEETATVPVLLQEEDGATHFTEGFGDLSFFWWCSRTKNTNTTRLSWL